jgi:hypothetical protein
MLIAGLGSLALGLYTGVEPMTATWRAAAAAWIVAWIAGRLLPIAAAAASDGLAEASLQDDESPAAVPAPIAVRNRR